VTRRLRKAVETPETAVASDIVTILASLPSSQDGERKAATKTITPDGKGGLAITEIYKGTKWWSGHERTVDSIDSFAELLEKVSRDPFAMIVRGRIAKDVNRARMLRRKTTRADGTGTIDEAEHRWLLIDADSLEADFDPLADPAATVAYVLGRLPEPFRGITCWYQFTSGAGIKPGIRIRLAFWLDRALGTEDLKLWFGAKADKIRLYPVDLSVFVCTHPIYVAHPLLAPGAWCPLGGRPRSGVVRGGSDTVAVPPIEKPQCEPGSRTYARSDSPRSASFQEALEYIGDHEGGGGCHAALLHVVGWYFGRHGSDADAGALKAAIEQTVAAACWDPKQGHGPDYIQAQMGSELDRLVRDIQQRQRDEEANKQREREAATRRWPEEGLPLQEAESVLRGALAHFFDVMVPDSVRLREQPETADDVFAEYAQVGIKVSPGVGKTHQAIEQMIATGRRCVFAIPTHAKAEEIEELANKLAGRTVARVWRGEGRPDPDAAGETMCRRAAVVAEIRKSGGARGDLCGSQERGFCPFYAACGYRRQEQQEPAIWIVPHSLLTSPPPATMKHVDALIVDEARSLEPYQHRLLIADLLASRAHRSGVLNRVSSTLRLMQPGELFIRGNLEASGISRKMCESAWKFEAKNFPKLSVSPTGDDIANVVRSKEVEAIYRMTVDRRRFWKELERFLAGDRGNTEVSTRLRLSADGQAVEVATRSMVDDAWLTRPVLHLDATMNEAAAQSWLPRLDLAADIRVERGPGVFVRQVTEQVGYRKLFTPKPDNAPPEATPLARSVLRRVEVTCAAYREVVGLIGPKGFIEAAEAVWLETGTRPANLLTAHFGALRGLNEMEEVIHLIVVSRPEPQAAEIEAIARPTFDQHPAKSLAGEFYPKRVVGLRMTAGGTEIVEEACHPDPVAHAILEQVRDAEVAQAAHRARPVRRSAERPLQIDLATNTVVDITVDQTMSLDSWLEVGVDELLAARGSVPEEWAGKHSVLRDVFPTVAALKMSAARGGGDQRNAKDYTGEFVTSSNRDSNKEMLRIQTLSAEPLNVKGSETPAASWPKYRYKVTGTRQRSTVAVNLLQHPDPAAAWAACLGVPVGELTVWERLDPPVEQPQPEASRAADPELRCTISPEATARLGIPPLPSARRPLGTRPAHELLAVRQRRTARRNGIARRSSVRRSAVWRRSRVHGAVLVRNKRVLNLVQGVEDFGLREVFIGPHLRASVAQRLADFDTAADGW
jgi:hypothetical protein